MTENKLRSIIREEARRIMELNMSDPKAAAPPPNPAVEDLAESLRRAGYVVSPHPTKVGRYVVKPMQTGFKVAMYADDNTSIPIDSVIIGPAPKTAKVGDKTIIMQMPG